MAKNSTPSLRKQALTILTVMLLTISFQSQARGDSPQPCGPAAKPGEKWLLNENFSDEFNAPGLDGDKWDNNPVSWGFWSWDPRNTYLQKEFLHLRMVQETHKRMEQELYYKSGIIRSHKKITYGFFEARVKGCSRFPGASPAFWLYTPGGAPASSKVKYCEVDIFEMQQAGWNHAKKERDDIHHIDMNLHYKIVNERGMVEFRRPGNQPELCKHDWRAPWDPRDDFHVYGCDVTPENITWYVDGTVVVREKNLYWHLPMAVTLSLGLRHPFVGWNKGEMFQIKETTTRDGFPTEMQVDYIRVWNRVKG